MPLIGLSMNDAPTDVC